MFNLTAITGLQLVVSFLIPLTQSNSSAAVFGVLVLVRKVLDFVYREKIRRENSKISSKVYRDGLKRYNMLQQSDRESDSAEYFEEILTKQRRFLMFDNVFTRSIINTGVNLAVFIIGYIVTTENVMPMIYVIVLEVCMYVVTRHFVKIVRDSLRIAKKTKKETRGLLHLEFSRMRVGQGSTNKICLEKERTRQTNDTIDSSWDSVNASITIPIILSMVYSNDYALVYMFMELVRFCDHCTFMISAFAENNVSKEEYKNFWKGKSHCTPLKQYRLPDILRITSYKETIVNLEISKSDVVLVSGLTGCGKTTFMNSLCGFTDDAQLSDHSTANYTNSVVYMRQDIRDSTPFGKVTLRNLFDGCPTSQIIDLLKVVGLGSWFKDADSYIDNKISGGEKTLLCIAIALSKVSGKQMVIFDEPEQGLHPSIIPRTLTSVVKYLTSREIRVILVSHVCGCVLKMLPEHKHWKLERTGNEVSIV